MTGPLAGTVSHPAETASHPMRVLLVSHYFPPHVGGIENVVYQEAIHLARRGARVTILTSGNATGTRRIEHGVRVVSVAAWNFFERRAGVPFPVLSPQLLPAAVRCARRADVIHIHDSLYMTSWAAGVAAAVTRTPFLVTQHVGLVQHRSALVRGVQRATCAVAGRRILRAAAHVLVVNAAVASFVRAQGTRRQAVRHLANGVDTGLFRPARSAAERAILRERFGLPQGAVLVLFAGRPVPKKGYDVLLAAADPAYELVFAGEDPARGGRATRPEASRPGVHHLGELSPTDLADLYRACDIFALPSTGEGFPLTVQEAMASGLPIVTTDDPGYEPYRLDRDHVALLPRQPEAYRTALLSLAASPERRHRAGRWSLTSSVACPTWDTHACQLLRLYAALLPRYTDRPGPVPAGAA